MRLGYEVRTGVRFPERGGQPSYRIATVEQQGTVIAKLTYAQGAVLWRINLGWTRRKNKSDYGFVLDIERGYWAKNEQAVDDTDLEPMSARTTKVIPYVKDTRNSLLFEPATQLAPEVIASLQAALKHAIQVRFQLEDNELAAEPLPTREDRRLILFYESAEGGAGVLKRLLDDSQAFAEVARTALELCHFDPNTGEDKHRAPQSQEDCEAACYDCLMTYGNQRDHALLDRQALRSLLLAFTQTQVVAAPATKPRSEHLEQLMQQAESSLEREWLEYLEARGHRLPTKAQVAIAACRTRPDFCYEQEMTVIYIDGPHHLFPDRAERDANQIECLEDFGYSVIRFGLQSDWHDVLQQYPHVFGAMQASGDTYTVSKSELMIESLDLDLFDSVWHSLIQSLAGTAGITIESGGDVIQNGRVIGDFLAEVTWEGIVLRLIDASNPEMEMIQRSLQAQGYRVLAIHPSMTDREILSAFGEVS